MCLIRFDNVTKTFNLYHNMFERIRDLNIFTKSSHKVHTVFENLCLKINPGEAIGVLGRNGAGKTTLLKLIAGISRPDSGKITVRGEVASILSLGSCFHPDFSGLDNIRFYASLIGFDQKSIAEKIESIIDFAEIGDFIDYPVKTYSSGMKVRLAFSTAISVDPEILVIDEVLAVGDANFKKKCLKKFETIKARNRTIVFTSHSLQLVKKFCTRAIVLDSGIHYDGEVDQAEKYYREILEAGNTA